MWGQQRKLRAERGADAPAPQSARCSDAESSGLHSNGLHSSALHSSALQNSDLQSSGLRSSGLRLDGSGLCLDASLPSMSEWLRLSEGLCGGQGHMPPSRPAAACS